MHQIKKGLRLKPPSGAPFALFDMKPRHTITSRALLALAVFMTSLVMMLDVLSQGQALAADKSFDRSRFSAQSIGIFSLNTEATFTGPGTIDLTHTLSPYEALKALGHITRSEQQLWNFENALSEDEIDAQSITFSKKPDSPDDDGLGEVDRMLAEINGVLEEIENIKFDDGLGDNQNNEKAKEIQNLERNTIETPADILATIPPAKIDAETIENKEISFVDAITKPVATTIQNHRAKIEERIPKISPERAPKIVARIDNDAATVITPQENKQAGSPKVAKSAPTQPTSYQDAALAQDLEAYARKKQKPTQKNKTSASLQALSQGDNAADIENKPLDHRLLERINAGDILTLTMPGEEKLTGEFAVNRDGALLLPEVGQITVSDLTVIEVSNKIKKELSTAYRNIDRLTVEVKEHKLIITVLGFVKTPGQVQLPEDGNVQTAISEAGGLAIGAQLDRLQVRRGDEVITFDYKTYLNSGDISILPSLKPLDVIFVPASPLTGAVEVPFSPENLAIQGDGGDDGQGIRVLGQVRTSVTMAFKEGTSLIDALMRAGGLSSSAEVSNIRIVSTAGSEVVDLQKMLDKGSLDELPQLTPGTTIYVPLRTNTPNPNSDLIYVMGEAHRPGSYPINGTTDFIKAIQTAGGPNRNADKTDIRIIRKDSQDIVIVDIPSFTQGNVESLPQVYPGDTIFIPTRKEYKQRSWLNIPTDQAVQVLGAVRKPDRYEWSDDMSFFDLIAVAGGPTNDANLAQVKVLEKKADGTINSVLFDMDKFIQFGGNIDDLPVIKAGYVVVVPSNKTTVEPNADSIKVLGEVSKPGSVTFDATQTVIDVLLKTGGVTRNAFVDRIRVVTNGVPSYVNLKEYLETGDAKLLPTLAPGSTIFVPAATENDRAKTGKSIFIMGEVEKPGAIQVRGEMSFIEAVAEAGGPTPFANAKTIRIIKVDGSVTPIDLAAFTQGRGGQLPSVSPGDTIFFPRKSEATNGKSWLNISSDRSVEVIGAVTRPARYEWSDDMTFFDLIAQAGGPTARANISKVQILIKEGGLTRPTVFNMERFIKEGGANQRLPKIRAGYVIHVPFAATETANSKSAWLKQSADESIYVFGQVVEPGRYGFSRDLSFIDIISAAGGPNTTADLRNIRVSHRNRANAKISKVNLSRYFETGDESILPHVVPGDVIYIPSREREWLDQSTAQTVRVLGAVGSPGRYRFEGDMSLLDLLAEAGGPTREALPKRIVVVNPNDGADKAKTFNLVKYAKSGDPTLMPVVRPGDTVYVPDRSQSAWAKVQSGISGTSSIVAFALALVAL